MTILFISDLHLSTQRPEKLELFQSFMRNAAHKATALYILGDLFEQFWVGNDDKTPPNPDIIATLREYTDNGGQAFILRGNRDLMLDKEFEALTGCRLIADETCIDIGGEKVLIMHGDLLCVLDIGYQRFRRFMESPITRWVFTHLPYRTRIALSHGLRPAIKKSTEKKKPEIIDVTQSAVNDALQRHQCQTLIHGHTHRPGFHDFELNSQPAQRIVLEDWYENDSVLVCEHGEKKLMRVQEYIDLQ